MTTEKQPPGKIYKWLDTPRHLAKSSGGTSNKELDLPSNPFMSAPKHRGAWKQPWIKLEFSG